MTEESCRSYCRYWPGVSVCVSVCVVKTLVGRRWHLGYQGPDVRTSPIVLYMPCEPLSAVAAIEIRMETVGLRHCLVNLVHESHGLFLFWPLVCEVCRI